MWCFGFIVRNSLLVARKQVKIFVVSRFISTLAFISIGMSVRGWKGRVICSSFSHWVSFSLVMWVIIYHHKTGPEQMMFTSWWCGGGRREIVCHKSLHFTSSGELFGLRLQREAPHGELKSDREHFRSCKNLFGCVSTVIYWTICHANINHIIYSIYV